MHAAVLLLLWKTKGNVTILQEKDDPSTVLDMMDCYFDDGPVSGMHDRLTIGTQRSASYEL